MFRFGLGKKAAQVEALIEKHGGINLNERFWTQDASLWKKESAKQKQILNRLGWMNITETMLGKVDDIKAFVEEIKREKFTDVVLMGMGGSSLAPDVMHQVFGIRQGFPKFNTLDSTDPDMISRLEQNIDLDKTLFIYSSKSGGTIEPASQFKYFWDKLTKSSVIKKPGKHFIAITDPGTPLVKLAKEKGFRKIFLNPPDIGGRYSVLSYFGLVPAALMGIYPEKLLLSADRVRKKSLGLKSINTDPAIRLGIILGQMAKIGVDKATFVIPGRLYPFGYWVEQLIAESTGKEGKGVIPIEGESIDVPDVYADDRIFIYLHLDIKSNAPFNKALSSIKEKGFPVIESILEEPYELGAEFYRWEIATAIMGHVLEIDAFDQPDVQAAKDATDKILKKFDSTGKLPTEKAKLSAEPFKVYYNDKMEKAIQSKIKGWKGKLTNIKDILAGFVSLSEKNNYLALLGYLPMEDEVEKEFDKIRNTIRENLSIATISGYGPRYLHSIGQLYKGGPDTGLFIIFTIDDEKDLPIPGEKYSFSQLKMAQALGDYQALLAANRRTIRVNLGSDYLANLNEFNDVLKKAFQSVSKK